MRSWSWAPNEASRTLGTGHIWQFLCLLCTAGTQYQFCNSVPVPMPVPCCSILSHLILWRRLVDAQRGSGSEGAARLEQQQKMLVQTIEGVQAARDAAEMSGQ